MNPSGLIAFKDKVLQAFAAVFPEIAYYGQSHLVGGELLEDIACHPGFQIEKPGVKMMFPENKAFGALVSAIHHQIHGFLGAADQDHTGMYFCNPGSIQLYNLNIHNS